jgi:hypothetical protein
LEACDDSVDRPAISEHPDFHCSNPSRFQRGDDLLAKDVRGNVVNPYHARVRLRGYRSDRA